jgi:hypothetical protein
VKVESDGGSQRIDDDDTKETRDDDTANSTDVIDFKQSLGSLPCNLLPHPVPMILMSLGRSGTSSMYQVISTLSGKETSRIYEYTGMEKK